jgi:hypothetical protein
LTLRVWLPTILPCTAVPVARVPPEPLKGQRGSFDRQPSLGPPSTRRKLMACFIIVYFPYRVCIFFCVPVPDDSCLARSWILSLQVRSLRRAFRKEPSSRAG